MIKLFMTAGASLVLAATAASAADLPSRRAPPVYVPPVVTVPYSWTGFEFGLTTSYSFAGNKSVATTPFGGTGGQPGFTSLSKQGIDTVGGGVAYNYQFTPGSGFVVGGAADVSFLNLKKFVPTIAVGGIGGDYQQRQAYFGTINGRVGYGFDHFLVYGVGGFAFGELHDNAVLASPGLPSPYIGTSNGIATGYDFGGGIEYAIPDDSFLNYLSVEKILGFDKKLGLDIFQSTVRAEFVHYDLGTRTVVATNPTFGGGFINRFKTEGNIVRFALGYKFGGTTAVPVVARY